MNQPRILVVGSTGMQGSAVAYRLLRSHHFQVRAMTRNPQSTHAQRLQMAGAEVVRGELDDLSSLTTCMQGVDGVFGVVNFWTIGNTQSSLDEKREGEVRQGKALVDACRLAGVTHYVYSSVGGTDRKADQHPHIMSKAEIEAYIAAAGQSATVIRPVWVFDNFAVSSVKEQILAGVLAVPLAPHVKLQMVAAEDIAAFAELAFENPQEFIGQSIELAGDELTGEEMAQVFSSALKRRIVFESTPIPGTDFLFEPGYYQADIPALRLRYPDLMPMETWASTLFSGKTILPDDVLLA